MKPAQMYRVWTPDEMERLKTSLLFGRSSEEIALELGRSVNAVRIRRNRFLPKSKPATDVNHGWSPGYGRIEKYWTEERIQEGLIDFAAKHRGPLPNSDHEYSRLKKGHMEWPTASAVLDLFGTMSDAWTAIGQGRARVTRQWVPWTQADDDYLLERAGEQTLKIIGKHLGRSWMACKRRLYDLGAGRARDVSGYLSAMQVAKEYNCPLSRVMKLIRSGELPAKRVQGGHYWRVAPEDCERLKATLSAPKTKSYQGSPPSLGDYDRRYGYRRIRVNGRTVRVAS